MNRKKLILYIGPYQPSYHIAFTRALENSGAQVSHFTYFDIRPYFLYYLLAKLSRVGLFSLSKKIQKYYAKLRLYKNYDFVIIHHGHKLSDEIYLNLKADNPDAKFINFHWDSLRDSYNYLEIIKYFDRVYSFDYDDCRKYPEIEYLPLFYLDEYYALRTKIEKPKHDIDLLFIGSWIDEDRYELIKKARQFCSENGLVFYYHLYFSLSNYCRELLNGKIKKEAKFRKLSHKEIAHLFSRAKVIIDFHNTFQSGLTMRTFEALGAGKKLLTTNSNILSEPFFNTNAVSVFSKTEFNIDLDFIRNGANSNSILEMNDYSIDNYVRKLLL